MSFKKLTSTALDYLMILLGNLIFALSVNYFIEPHSIPMGGLSGIALILFKEFSLPIGLMIMVMNIPLFVIGYRAMGKKFIIRTFFSVVVGSLMIDLLPPILPLFHVDEQLVAALYGGIASGLGCGLIFSRGATSGGVDIISKLIQKKHGHLSIGRIWLAVNFVIFVISAIIFKNPEAVLYALISQFISSAALDAFLSGMDSATSAFIITTLPEEVREVLLTQVKRGATAIDGTGMFSGSPKTVYLCAVRRYEITAMKKAVMSVDPEAFIILSNVQEVLGTGFKPLTPP